MANASIRCFFCGEQTEIREEETKSETARNREWSTLLVERNGVETKVDGYVCPTCLSILQNPNRVSVRQEAKKFGKGGAHLVLRPGRVVGQDVICIYTMPPEKGGK